MSGVVFADEFAGGLLREETAEEANAVSHVRRENAAERYDPHGGI